MKRKPGYTHLWLWRKTLRFPFSSTINRSNENSPDLRTVYLEKKFKICFRSKI